MASLKPDTALNLLHGVGLLIQYACIWIVQDLLHHQGGLWYNIANLIGIVIGLCVGLSLLTWWLMNKATNVDFLIATDSEMKKVNWTSKQELIGSTKVVIVFMFVTAIFLFVFVVQLVIQGVHEMAEQQYLPYSDILHARTEAKIKESAIDVVPYDSY